MRQHLRSIGSKIRPPKKKTVKNFQLYLSLFSTLATIILFLIALSNVDRLIPMHQKCMNGVLYYKFALSVTAALTPAGKPVTCTGE
jgi:predicted cation transporter